MFEILEKRFYISADIEGIAGVASRENLSPGRFEYEQARDWMTDAVLVACETLTEHGATEVVVSDSHGNGQNIHWERMPDHVRLVRSWPRPLGMMQGIEGGPYEGALLIGYHAGASNIGGTLSHTVSGEFFQEIRLNGVPSSEAAISAAIAGHYGVPILLMAGDDVAVEETSALLPGIATACLKSSYGFLSICTLSPGAAERVLRTGVAEAVEKAGTLAPFAVAAPVSLEIRLRTRFIAEWLAYLDNVERIDAFTIRMQCADIIGVSHFLQFITAARGALA
ncbi:M55 family metallopeptidase [Sphingosinicellaceae bacterium]|nr:M55 family metallopeptidase [Sphingosinicellaceae bacterium]